MPCGKLASLYRRKMLLKKAETTDMKRIQTVYIGVKSGLFQLKSNPLLHKKREVINSFKGFPQSFPQVIPVFSTGFYHELHFTKWAIWCV